MKFSKITLPAVALILFIASCKDNPEKEIRLLSRNFGEQIETVQNLSFSFNHDLAPTATIGEWDTTEYIRFEPAVAGKFRWVSRTELVFSPATGFSGSTDYKAIFTDKLFENAEDKELYLQDELENGLEFHTAYLQMENIQAFWARAQENNNIIIKTKLYFNYAVEPSQIQSLAKVSINEENTTFKITGSDAGKEIDLEIAGADYGKEDLIIKVLLQKGLKPAEGGFQTKEDTELSQVLSSRFKLEIIDVTTEFDGTRGVITVHTSQELSEQNLNSAYSVSPEATTTAELLPNGFEVSGEFDLTQAYTFTINTSLKGTLGGVMKENYSKTFSFESKPSIRFVHNKALYLSSAGNKSIGLNIINVPKVKVKIYKIYENNILSYLRQNDDYYGYYDDDNENRYYVDESNLFSDVVYDKEINTGSLPRINGMTSLKLEIPGENKKYKGIYLVKVSSSEQNYLNATKLVSVSDIGLIAKAMDNKVLVMAHSIITAEPLSGIDIKLVSTNNQLMTGKQTGADGVVIFDKLDKAAPGFEVGMITALGQDDFNYMPYNGTMVESSRFEVGGKYDHHSGFEAYVYGPRNMYRPGEKIHFNTIVRRSNWESPGEVPLKFRLLLPNGKEFRSERKNTNAQGAAEMEFQLPDNAITGFYHFEVLNGDGNLLNSMNINVEEFMPDRIKIKIESNKEDFSGSDTAIIYGTATNMFGPPAVGRNYEITRRLGKKYFHSKSFPDFEFNIEDQTNFDSEMRQGKTDEEGKFSERFPGKNTYKDMGVLEATFYTTVFDESGRPVNRINSYDIYTQESFYGINIPDYYVSTQKPSTFKIVGVNKKDKPAIGKKAMVQIYRIEWQTVLENGSGYYNYRSKRIEKLVETKTLTLGASPTPLTFIPRVSGQYEIRVMRPGSDRYTRQNFYAYGWGNTSSTAFEVNTEGQVGIELDKEVYRVGDKATVLFKTPFKGKLLVSIERDDVYAYEVIQTDEKAAQYSFEIKEEHLPNVFISATLIRPMGSSEMPLTVAHGYAPVMTEKPDSRLPLEIVAVESSRSKTKQKIKVKSKASSNIQVTLAVVDEGILQLKNFQSPDPHGWFYQKRALQVQSYDIYAFLFPELMQKSKVGGDGSDKGYDLGKRVNPLSNKRVKLISLWSGILKTDSKGEVEYEIDIPQFNGELRIMAVAYKDKSFGSASKSMKVADPVVINTSLPRFLSPGDELALPVTLSNTTKKDGNAKISVQVSGPLEIDGEKTASIKLDAMQENRSEFNLKVQPQIGNAKVTVKVTALGETFTEETEITVRPSAGLLKFSGSGSIGNAGSTLVDLESQAELLPQSRDAQLVISKSPMLMYMKEMKSLLGYPHGCIEQTVSKAFPQIYLADFLKEAGEEVVTEDENELNPYFNVQSAIRKISAMQQYNGAMSYWPGGSYTSWWGTAFAAHFLLEARKAGFEVDENVLDKCFDFLTYMSRKKEIEEEWYYGGEYWRQRNIASRSQIYSLFVLASAGRPDKSLMNYYKVNTEILSADSRYLLACAYALTGDMKSYRDLLPATYRAEQTRKMFDGSFASPLRNLAISLYALIEGDPNNPQIGALAKNLSEQIRSNRYLNTQEMVFSFVALGKLSKKAAETNMTATVKVDGKSYGSFAGKMLKINNKELAGKKVTITTTGSGTLYYFWETEGISSTGKYKEEDSHLRVRRTYYDRYGRQIFNNEFKQNDLVVVKLSLATTDNTRAENVVLTDMLPAGLEIENPRISEGLQFDWIKERATPQHFDIRDDRIHFYLTAQPREQYLYYVVRAVSKGHFKLGPASADAMYNGEYHSYHGGGSILVK